MKSCCCTVFVCLILFSCSKKSGDQKNSHQHNVTGFTLDSLVAMGTNNWFTRFDSAYAMYSLFAGTRQEVELAGDGYWVQVSAASLKNPPSSRHDAPDEWITSQGVYIGIPLDSLERINEVPFYLRFDNNTLSIMSWEGGKLFRRRVWTEFAIEKGGTPDLIMSSADIIRKGWVVRVKTIKVYLANIDGNNWDEPDETCKGYPGNYPHLSFAPLDPNQLKGLSASNLRFMRNEIFARNGYIFTSPDLKDFFSKMWWYRPTVANVDDRLTEIEKENINTLRMFEGQWKYRPLAKQIKALPFLQLPFDLEQGFINSVGLDSGAETPDGDRVTTERSYLHYLLPDTSSAYAVLWTGYVGGNDVGFHDDTVRYMTFITTFDKKMNLINSKSVKIHDYSRRHPTDNYCTTEESQESTLKADWSFSSEWVYSGKCEEVGQYQILTAGSSRVWGRIGKDGKIEWERRDVPP